MYVIHISGIVLLFLACHTLKVTQFLTDIYIDFAFTHPIILIYQQYMYKKFLFF